jgi:hypothetical protein
MRNLRPLKGIREHPKTRPSTEKRLKNHVASVLGIDVSQQEVNRVLAELKALSAVSLKGTKVEYNFQGK